MRGSSASDPVLRHNRLIFVPTDHALPDGNAWSIHGGDLERPRGDFDYEQYRLAAFR